MTYLANKSHIAKAIRFYVMEATTQIAKAITVSYSGYGQDPS